MYSKYTGIILKKHPFNEADELLTIYTREAGKLRCKSISSRKLQSRLGGHLQTLNEIQFETAGSNNSSASALPVLTSVRALRINSYLRENLRKFAAVLVGVETVYRLLPDRQENQQVYEAILEFLTRLGLAVDENFEVRRFQLELLKHAGYAFPANDYDLGEASRKQLSELSVGQSSFRLGREIELAIDRFLNYVLEREIKSSRFLRTLNQDSS